MGRLEGEKGTACVSLDSLQAPLKLTALTEEYFWTIAPPSLCPSPHHPSSAIALLIPVAAGTEGTGTVLSTEAERTEPGGAAMEAEAGGERGFELAAELSMD